MSLIRTNTAAPSWYVFDKIYDNKQAMDAGYSSDGVLLGRYVLIRYSEYNFTEAEKELLIKGAKHNLHIQPIGDEWDAYSKVYNTSQARQVFYRNLSIDMWEKYKMTGSGSNAQPGPEDTWDKNLRDCYDRVFFRKGANGYEEMDSLVIPEDLKQLREEVNGALQEVKDLEEQITNGIDSEDGYIDNKIDDKISNKLAMVDTF